MIIQLNILLYELDIFVLMILIFLFAKMFLGK